MENFKYLLVIGANEVLGESVVKVFKNNSSSWKIIAVGSEENALADKNILIGEEENYNEDLVKRLYEEIESFTSNLHSIINVAGRFIKGSIKSLDVFKDSEEMFNCNYYSSLLAAHLSTKYMGSGGLLIFTGAAKVFKDPAPDMLAYQIAKTATHSLAWGLKDSNDLPQDTIIITILTEIIDTPENRKIMPLEDPSKWPKPEGIAALLKMWADGFNRPKSGSFALLKNKDNYVIPEFV